MASETKSPDTSEQPFVHSPGPWRRDGFAPDIIRSAVIRDATGFEVATARSWINDQYEGNANLVAAAPELLETLKNVLVETNFISLEAARDYIREVLESLKVV